MSFQDTFNAKMAATRFDGCRYEFSTEAVEDRTASIKEGRVVYRNRDVCTVFKVGGNGDSVQWIIEELPQDKMARIAGPYAAWKEGREEAINGTPLEQWPVITPAEIANLKHFKVKSVEDLAGVPDNMLPNLGMGARALRDKARAWLTSATDNGRLAQQIAAINVAMDDMKERLAEKDQIIAELTAQLPERRSPGRPRKAEASEAA